MINWRGVWVFCVHGLLIVSLFEKKLVGVKGPEGVKHKILCQVREEGTTTTKICGRLLQAAL